MARTLRALVLLENSDRSLHTNARLEDIEFGFKQLGFETTHIAGGNLCISGEPQTFEKVFGEKAKEISVLDRKEPSKTREAHSLPVGSLPQNLKQLVKAIEFEGGLDFGPENF